MIPLRHKLGLGFAALAIAISAVLTFSLFYNFKNQLREDIRTRLADAVAIAALQLDGDAHSMLQNAAQEASDDYGAFRGTLQRIRARGTDIRRVYTLRKGPDNRIAVVADSGDKTGKAWGLGRPHGEAGPLLARTFNGMQGPLVEKEYFSDTSGQVLRGYAPFYTSSGRFEGVLAMDVAADQVKERQDRFLRTALGVFGLCVILAVALGHLLGRSLAGPIMTLIQGAEAIAKGDLDHRVQVTAQDETRVLADAFNAMTHKLAQSRGQLTREIEDRKAAEAALSASEEKYRSIFENAVEGIFQCDPDGRFLSANPAMARILGYDSPDSLSASGASLMQVLGGPGRDALLEVLAGQGNASDFEVRFLVKDGQERWGAVNARAFTDQDSRIKLIEGSFEDITQRKENETLLQSRIEAEAAGKAKAELLASVTAQMRAPMNAILSMAELLGETRLSEIQQPYVDNLISASDSLLAHIGNILVLSKAEAGTLELESIPFNLLELVEKTCEALAVRAHERNLDLTGHIVPGIPTHLVGDPFHLRQVLVNVISNAIQLALEGEVAVEVRQMECPAEEKTARIEFSISYIGPEVPSEELAASFRVITQEDVAKAGEDDGAGLSLRITRHLVHLMGGRMAVESSGEARSRIIFTVLLDRQEKQKDIFSPQPILKDMSVVVADNDTKNRLFLREILNNMGAKTADAEDGQATLSLLKESWMMPRPYDMVLLGQTMPDMDGFEIVELINIERLCPVVILMFNFSATHEDVSRARELGIEYFVKKPIKKGQILKVLNSAAKELRGTRPAAEEPPRDRGALPPLDILFVEDSETNRYVVRAYLKNTPCKIHIAENGEKGLEKFISRPFDLVLMDMQMPVMDGKTATSRIREWEKKNRPKRTPIIAMTADARQEEEKDYLAAGFDGLLVKPIKKNQLLAGILKQILGNSRAPAREEGADHAIKTLGAGTDEPILAWVNPDLADIAPHYLQSVGENTRAIAEALSKKDFDSIRIMGHRMKGEGNAFGFEAVSILGATIQEGALAADSKKITEAVDKLKDYLARVEIV